MSGTIPPEAIKQREETKQKLLLKKCKEARKELKGEVPSKWLRFQPTRKLAIEKGDKYFFSGLPCKHGHIDLRTINNSVCKACAEIRWARKRAETDARGRKPTPRRDAKNKGLKTYIGWCGYCKKEVKKLTINHACIDCINRRRREYGKTDAGKEASKRQNLKKAPGGERYEQNREYRKHLYQEKNEQINKTRRIYTTKRSKEDPNFRIYDTLRKRCQSYIRTKRITKADRTIKLIGCSQQELLNHIEEQFKDGMSFDNYGLWQVDHIRPCNSFDFQIKQHQFVAFNWRNLQPLWSEDNLQKGDDYTPLDEVAWVERMIDLEYEGELFLKYEEGNSY